MPVRAIFLMIGQYLPQGGIGGLSWPRGFRTTMTKLECETIYNLREQKGEGDEAIWDRKVNGSCIHYMVGIILCSDFMYS
jgi:hypothetical protein